MMLLNMKYKILNMQSTERKKKNQESGRLTAIKNYFPRGDLWMKTHKLWLLHSCVKHCWIHVLTCVPSFPQSYFSWCHYRINTFVTRQQWSTRDDVFWESLQIFQPFDSYTKWNKLICKVKFGYCLKLHIYHIT